MPRPLILAHRGLVTEHQENSLAAIRAALESPHCDGAEFDVFLTKDGKVVAFHDENLKRLTGVDRSIYDCTWEELKHIPLLTAIEVDGGMREYPHPQPISLLTDILEETRGKHFFMDVELKAYDVSWGKRQVGREVARIVRDLKMEEQCVLTSFNFFMIRAAEAEYPHIRTGVAYDDNMPLPGKWLNRILESNLLGKLLHADMAIAEYTLFDDDTLAKFSRRHKQVGSFTFFPLTPDNNDHARIAEHTRVLQRLAAAGLHWVETDRPELAVQALW